MSEVEKFKCIGYMVGRSRVGGAEYVRLSDFDRVTADLKSANADKEAYAQNAIDLRKRVDALQQRLTAADERMDVLEGLVGEVLDAVGREPLDLDAVLRLRARMRAALKPAEGCKHSYHYFGTEQPRRRCNLCNKLEPVEGGGDAG